MPPATMWDQVKRQKDALGAPTKLALAAQALVQALEAELARAMQPRESAPGLADAEQWLRSAAEQQHGQTPAIAAELDRLRAEVTDLKARLYAEQYEADNLVGASHDEVLKLRSENLKWQSEHTALKLDYHNVEAEVARLSRENAELKAQQLEKIEELPAPQPAETAMRTVWAVRYSNYEPAEIDSLWAMEAHAHQRCQQLGDSWSVEEMTVQTATKEPTP